MKINNTLIIIGIVIVYLFYLYYKSLCSKNITEIKTKTKKSKQYKKKVNDDDLSYDLSYESENELSESDSLDKTHNYSKYDLGSLDTTFNSLDSDFSQ
jgi:phosphate-selective porin